MIQRFVDKFMERQDKLKKKYTEVHPDCYTEIVKDVAKLLGLDAEAMVIIEGKDYQGINRYIFNEPYGSCYMVAVDYGSCTMCDTLESIRYQGSWGDAPTEQQIEDYLTLALHIVQDIREI